MKLLIPYAPSTIDLAITYRCNLGCNHCNLSCKIGVGEEMSFGRFTDIYEQILNMGVFKIYLQGGEPFVHSEIKSILEWLTEHSGGIRIIINTNGILLNENIIELISHNKDIEIVISLYENVLKNPTRFRELIDNMNALNKHGVRIGANYLATNENLSLIETRYYEFEPFISSFNIIKYVPISTESRFSLDIPYVNWKSFLTQMTLRKKGR